MNRRFLLLVNSPALVLGLFLVLGCGVTLWALNGAQVRLSRGLHYQVECLRAAHEMEVAVLKLRSHSLSNALGPTTAGQQALQLDHQEFERALEQAKKLASPDQAALMTEIEASYRQYLARLDYLRRQARATGSYAEQAEDDHPAQHVVASCENLLQHNQALMENALLDSEVSSRNLQWTLLGLGVLGPALGIACGYAIARSIARSFGRLQVRVLDVQSHLAPDVIVDVKPGLDSLDDRLQFICTRVQSLLERLRLQQRDMVHAEQLALVGRLASSFAHEIRNPLTAMKWLVDAAVRTYPDEPMPIEDLKVLQNEIDRLARTVQEMLEFARPSKPQRSSCDLRDALARAADLIRPRARQLDVRCNLDLPADAVQAEVDATQMNSVLVNLMLNALEAMPHGGSLDVTLTMPGAESALITVDDTGPGIQAEVLDRLFEPFTTTKPTGTGLGLSLSRRLVEDHGGTLTAENRPHGGARFTVCLPLVVHSPEREVSCPSLKC